MEMMLLLVRKKRCPGIYTNLAQSQLGEDDTGRTHVD